MKQLVTIREYGELTTRKVESTLDLAHVPPSAFEWLCELSATFKRSGATLLQIEGQRSLRWDSYVGVVETPCGTRIEVLPKHFEEGDCIKQSRNLLRKLIQRALSIKPRHASVTGLELFDAPLSEWVMGQFLSEVDHLVKRGVRSDYHRLEEEQRFLRGQLNVVAQMRQPPGRQHHFQIRHDVFLPDRAENRLIKRALMQTCSTTQDPLNWRLANELRAMLSEIPSSRDVATDFRQWSRDRLMAHYVPIEPWCKLVLNQQMPIAVSGDQQGISLLFPMEKLFERYVEAWLRANLHVDASLKGQAASQYLCEHDNTKMFCLKPDLLIDTGKQRWILDAKWKRLNAAQRDQNYWLSQADFYQLFAYGHKYRTEHDVPGLVLIYPYWSGLKAALPIFSYGQGLNLYVLPFDLNADRLGDAELAGLPLRQFVNRNGAMDE